MTHLPAQFWLQQIHEELNLMHINVVNEIRSTKDVCRSIELHLACHLAAKGGWRRLLFEAKHDFSHLSIFFHDPALYGIRLQHLDVLENNLGDFLIVGNTFFGQVNGNAEGFKVGRAAGASCTQRDSPSFLLQMRKNGSFTFMTNEMGKVLCGLFIRGW